VGWVAHDWGSTAADRAIAFPCDAFIDEAADTLWRAVDVDAPAPTVFRWLCQLRVAPYSYDWIDNWGRTSPRTLTPGLDALDEGQRVMTIFDLVAFEPDRHLTLRLRRANGPFGDVALTYLVVPRGSAGSRLVVKVRWRYASPPIPARLARVVLPWGDLVMMRKQLLTLKALAERDHAGERRAPGGARTADDAAPLAGASERRKTMRNTITAVLTALAVMATGGAAARAEVSPGDEIDAGNVDKVKDMLSPGMQWCVKRGFPITVTETRHVEWPKAYKEATEKYAPQVKLSADGLAVQNYVAGQPFPALDMKDPQLALKIMWNYEYGFVNGLDDTDLRNFDADTGSIPQDGPMTVERHATKASLPSPRFPGEQGWYYHQGEKAGIMDDWFTVAALVAAGR
jgi:hypothetical protein